MWTTRRQAFKFDELSGADEAWVAVRLEGWQVVWTEDAAAREAEAQWDGCAG
jgi:hypothetical protein